MIKDFEISCLFRNDMFPGAFKRVQDGSRYLNDRIEAMYQGYKMAADHKIAMHERCNPDRYVSIGMWNHAIVEWNLAHGMINGLSSLPLTAKLMELPEEEYQRLFKVILKVAADSPV